MKRTTVMNTECAKFNDLPKLEKVYDQKKETEQRIRLHNELGRISLNLFKRTNETTHLDQALEQFQTAKRFATHGLELQKELVRLLEERDGK